MKNPVEFLYGAKNLEKIYSEMVTKLIGEPEVRLQRHPEVGLQMSFVTISVYVSI